MRKLSFYLLFAFLALLVILDTFVPSVDAKKKKKKKKKSPAPKAVTTSATEAAVTSSKDHPTSTVTHLSLYTHIFNDAQDQEALSSKFAHFVSIEQMVATMAIKPTNVPPIIQIESGAKIPGSKCRCVCKRKAVIE